MQSIPDSRDVYRTDTASNHPHRRGLPVVVPYSRPSSRIRCPVASSSSVGNGPPPTRVLYAFATPITLLIHFGGTPDPPQTPTPEALLLVTYGNVPWSISRSDPCAPSNNTRLPPSTASS